MRGGRPGPQRRRFTGRDLGVGRQFEHHPAATALAAGEHTRRAARHRLVQRQPPAQAAPLHQAGQLGAPCAASRYGKTEAWIVLEAAPGAVVHLGFTRDVDAAELTGWVRAQDVGSMLAATNQVPVAAGDTVLCPAGMPHAIGEGILLVELQEPTDWSVILEWRGFPLAPAT
jgi:mannose-6-phosphate isomerase